MSFRDVFRLKTGTGLPTLADEVIQRLDDYGDRIGVAEAQVQQLTEDIGAVLEKLDSEQTSRQSDVAYLRGRVEACENTLSGMINEVTNMLITISKLARKARR